MSGLTLPLLLTFAAVVVTFLAYRGIRRGGARFYTLEREAILRQASYTLMVAAFLFIGAITLLAYDLRQRTMEEAAESGQVIEGFATATSEPAVDTFPPTPTLTPTPDPSIPTVTPTPVLRRAIVEGTFGNGLYLRSEPNGEVLQTLPEGAFVTLLETAPVTGDGFNWVHVRTIGGDDGWVADNFLVVSER